MVLLDDRDLEEERRVGFCEFMFRFLGIGKGGNIFFRYLEGVVFLGDSLLLV